MKCCVRGILIVCLLGTAAVAMPSEVPSEDTGRQSAQGNLVEHMLGDCLKKDSLSCFKYKLFSYLDNTFGIKDAFSLGDGVKVVKTESTDGSPRSQDEKPSDIETMVVNRFERFMDTHTFKFDVKGSDIINGFSNVANSMGLLGDDDGAEGRSKKKKAAKLLLPLLLAMKLKLAALVPFAIAAIALIAKKALLVGKLALLIAGILGVKKLFGQHQKSVTYEIVSQPHHSGHDVWSNNDYGGSGGNGGGHGGGGWGRSSDVAQKLAYKAYQPHN